MTKRFPGIHCVLYALFDRNEELDRGLMREQLAVVGGTGCDGVTVLGLATEVNKLTHAERCRLIEWTAADRTQGAFSVTITGNSVAEQKYLAHMACDHGADWLILQPPMAGDFAQSEYIDFFARVAEGLGVPIAIQNAPQFLGRSLSEADISNLRSRNPLINHIKAEVPATQLANLTASARDLTVLNGRGGFEMIDCLEAGCEGFIVAPEVIDRIVATYRRWHNGRLADAEASYVGFLPAALFTMQSLESLICYGKRLFGERARIAVHDRAPALRPSSFGSRQVAKYAAQLESLRKV